MRQLNCEDGFLDWSVRCFVMLRSLFCPGAWEDGAQDLEVDVAAVRIFQIRTAICVKSISDQNYTQPDEVTNRSQAPI